MTVKLNRTLAAVGVASSALLVAFCSQQSMPTSPAAAGATTARALAAVGDTTTNTPQVTLVKICKLGNVSGTFTVSASPVSGGTASVLSPITVTSGTCRIAAIDSDTVSGVGSNVTVNETSAGLQTVTAVLIGADNTVNTIPFVNGQTQLFLNGFHGYVVTFTNNVVTPPPATEGCSPGYFKNHTSTPTYNRNQTLDAVLQTNVFPSSLTIGAALSLQGGGVNALARHAAAAILNSVALDGNYAYTISQLIAIFNQIEAGTLSIEAASNLLESKEDNGTTITCPLS